MAKTFLFDNYNLGAYVPLGGIGAGYAFPPLDAYVGENKLQTWQIKKTDDKGQPFVEVDNAKVPYLYWDAENFGTSKVMDPMRAFTGMVLERAFSIKEFKVPTGISKPDGKGGQKMVYETNTEELMANNLSLNNQRIDFLNYSVHKIGGYGPYKFEITLPEKYKDFEEFKGPADEVGNQVRANLIYARDFIKQTSEEGYKMYFSDYNFQIQSEEFGLSIVPVVEAADAYDAPLPLGKLSGEKHETSLTFAYAYKTIAGVTKFKEEKGQEHVLDYKRGDEIKIELSQNSSDYIDLVTNKNTSLTSVSELKNIIIDAYALDGANKALPKDRGKVDLNKIYNRITLSIPARKVKNKKINNVYDVGDEHFNRIGLSSFDFYDYSIRESEPNSTLFPEGGWSRKNKDPQAVDFSTYAMITGSNLIVPSTEGPIATGQDAESLVKATPKIVEIENTAFQDFKQEKNDRAKRFAYNGATKVNGISGLMTPSFCYISNKTLLDWHHAAPKCAYGKCKGEDKLNTYNFTTLMDEDNYGRPMISAWGYEPGAFDLNTIDSQESIHFSQTNLWSTIEDTQLYNNTKQTTVPNSPTKLVKEDFYYLPYFPYGENLLKAAKGEKSDLKSVGTELSMNRQHLIGVKILKTSKAADYSKANFGFEDNDIIQTFFFNVQLQDSIRNYVFYDSQIIMEKTYYYTPIAVYEVEGAEYTYTNIEDINFPAMTAEGAGKVDETAEKCSQKCAEQAAASKGFGAGGGGGDGFGGGGFNFQDCLAQCIQEAKAEEALKGEQLIKKNFGKPKGVRFNLEVFPKSKFYEIPVIEESVESVIINYPPLAPVVEFNPLEGVGNKMQIFFQEQIQGVPGLEEFIVKTNSDKVHQLLYKRSEKYFNEEDWSDEAMAMGLFGTKHLYYQSQGDLTKITTYRLDRKPTGTTKQQNYEDMLENGVVTEVQYDRLQTGFNDSIKTNVKYYYTFVTQDVYGLNSYPSVIYEVELVEDSGFIYPVIDLFDLDVILQAEEKKRQVLKKEFSQYLRIEPSFIQKIVEYSPGEGDLMVGPLDGSTQLYSNDTYLDNSSTDYPRIKVRIRSKKTKRAFDLNLKYIFKKEELKDKLELDKLSPNAKFVKKVTK